MARVAVLEIELPGGRIATVEVELPEEGPVVPPLPEELPIRRAARAVVPAVRDGVEAFAAPFLPLRARTIPELLTMPARNPLEAPGRAVKGAAASVLRRPGAPTASVPFEAVRAVGREIAGAAAESAPFTPLEFGAAAGGELMGGMAGRGERRVLGFREADMAPITGEPGRVTRLAEERGITLPPGAMTDRPDIQALEGALAQARGGEALVRQRKEAERALAGEAERFASQFGEQKGPEAAGASTQQALDSWFQKAKRVENKAYARLGRLAGNAELTPEFPSEAEKYIEKIFKQRGISVEPETGKLLSRLETADVSKYEPLSRVLRDLKGKRITYNDLQQMRTLIGEHADFESVRASGIQAVYKGLYGAFSKDMIGLAQRAGFGLQSQLARNLSKGIIDFSESDVSNTIRNAAPEQVVDKLVRANSVTNVKQLFGRITEKAKDVVRRAWLDKIFEQSVTEGALNPTRLSTNLGKYKPETIQALFGDSAKDVIDLRDIAGALARGQRYRQGSPTMPLTVAEELFEGKPLKAALKTLQRKMTAARLMAPGTRAAILGRGTPATPLELGFGESAAGAAVPGTRAFFPPGVEPERLEK